MDMSPPSVSGVSGSEGGIVPGNNDSFEDIPEEPILHNKLLLLMRVEQEDGRPFPVGTYSKCCVHSKLVQWTDVTEEHITKMNSYDSQCFCGCCLSAVACNA